MFPLFPFNCYLGFNFKRDITADYNVACSSKRPFIFTEEYLTGRIISPGYNVLAYYNQNVICRWLIIAPSDKLIEFFIERDAFGLDMEGVASLTFYDGDEVLSTKTRRFNISQRVYSKSNVVRVLFNGMNAPKAKGFEFYFQHVDKPIECSSPDDLNCRNRFQCYSKEKTCNKETSCSDGTDEENCPNEKDNLSFADSCGIPVIKPSILGAHIFGGEKVVPGSWPWLASLRFRSSSPINHVCGAAIINRSWVVTAAHCILNVPNDRFEVHFGRFNSIIPTSGKEVYRYIEKSILHPSFVFRITDESEVINSTYDIALIKLNAPLPVDNDYIRPICLPDVDIPIRENSAACVIGWGNPVKVDTEDLFLKQAEVPIISLDRCRKQHPQDANKIRDHVICAGRLEGGIDSCDGDSGGPLMILDSKSGKWKIIGIVASGVTTCGEQGKPGVYTSIPYYRDWIIQTIKDN